MMAAGIHRLALAAVVATSPAFSVAQADTVALPTTMSPEATVLPRALYGADVKSTKVPDPTDVSAWKQLQDYQAANNPRAEAAQAVIPGLGVEVTAFLSETWPHASRVRSRAIAAERFHCDDHDQFRRHLVDFLLRRVNSPHQQLRTTPQDPSWPDALRVHRQMLDFRAGAIHN